MPAHRPTGCASPLRRRLAAVVAGAFALSAMLAAAPLGAQEPPAALTGVLKRIKESRVVRIGYREGAVPFSVAGAGGRPWGYSIDLCEAIAEDIAHAVGDVALRVEYRRVTPADRLAQVEQGRVDFECGSTSNTAERRERVAFSPVTFFAGTRLLVRRGGPVRTARDLGGRRVVVVRGTTNEATMRQRASLAARPFELGVVADYEAALRAIDSGSADALAADDVLIAGLLSASDARRRYAMVGELLSYDPYGIVFAKGDAPLAAVVTATFRRLAASGEIRGIYDRWFLRRLPSGDRLGLPMSPQLERAFGMLGLAPT